MDISPVTLWVPGCSEFLPERCAGMFCMSRVNADKRQINLKIQLMERKLQRSKEVSNGLMR